MKMKTLPSFKELLPLSLLLAFAIAPLARAATQKAGPRPCDILAHKSPCVAAYSTTRALYRNYKDALYMITRKSDMTSINIGLLPGGYVNAARQDAFCAHTTCTIVRIYDQSPNHNDLTPAPPGGAAHGLGPNGYDRPAVADALPITIAGHHAYGIAISPGMGYRIDHPKGTAVNGQPEGVYMVTSALHLNNKCCFDFGNAEANNLDNNAGHMDAINIMCHGIPCKPDAGLDMENGIYGHLAVPAGTPFVTDMGINDGQLRYAIYQGNAQSRGKSGDLTTTGLIPLPKGYQPMQQEGAIILGIGGDNSNWATGYFFEAAMTHGMPSAKVLKAVQRNIVAAHYSGRLKP